MLLKILLFTLPVQVLQSRSCLSYVSYATTVRYRLVEWAPETVFAVWLKEKYLLYYKSKLDSPGHSPDTARADFERAKKLIFYTLNYFKLKRLAVVSSLYSPGTDRTENISSIIMFSLVSGETCP
jgi:hypothetical protein